MGLGGIAAGGLLLVAGGVVAVVLFWPWGLLLALPAAGGVLVVAVYVVTDLAELRDAFRFRSDSRHNVLVAQAEAGDVKEVPALPRVIPVNVSNSQRLVSDDFVVESAALATDRYLVALLDLVQRAELVGLSRRALLSSCPGQSTRQQREFYDWSMSLLQYVGAIEGRGPRSAGHLVTDAAGARRLILQAWGESHTMSMEAGTD